MNEAQVTVDNRTYPLPQPFMVLATQNPVEHHGTYPLPESQLDRFLLRVRMGYPDRASEKEILRESADSRRIGPCEIDSMPGDGSGTTSPRCSRNRGMRARG